MRITDLRLVPGAVVVWAAAWIVTGTAAPDSLARACGWLAAVVAAGLALLAVLRAGRHARVRRRRAGGPSAAAHAALAAGCALAVVASGTVDGTRAAPVRELADGGFTAELTGTVATEPTPFSWGAEPGAAGTASEPDPQRHVRYVLDVESVTARSVSSAGHGRVQVTSAPVAGLRFGSVVTVRGRLRPPRPGGTETATLTADPVTPQRPPPALLGHLDGHRDALMDVTEDLSPQARGLVPGAAIGDTTRIPEGLEEDMRTVGLTHVTAVSGGHFAVVITLLTGIAGMFGAPRWARVALLAVAGTAFVALVRPEPSVVRAAVMAAFALAGTLLGRPAQSVPALAGTVIGVLVLDPWLSRSFGFALSAAATAGLVLLVPPLVERLAPWTGKGLAFALAVPCAAQAACGPILVLLDPAVSLVSVPANLLVSPAVVPATVLGLAATILAPWWAEGAHAVAWLAGGSTWWIAEVAGRGAALPGGVVPWPGGVGGALLLAGATASALAVVLAGRPARGWPDAWRRQAGSGLRRAYGTARRSVSGRSRDMARSGGADPHRRGVPRRDRWPGRHGPRPGWRAVDLRVVTGVLVVCVAVGAVVLAVPRVLARTDMPTDWAVVACDVGQGDGTVIRTGPASAIVVDVGPDGDAAGRCLDGLGVTRVDLLVLSHFHADHVAGLPAVLTGREVAAALVSPLDDPPDAAERVRRELAAADVPVRPATAGDHGVSGAGASGTVTWEVLLAGGSGAAAVPGEAGASDPSANDSSVTLLVRAAGIEVVLLGDLEDAGQESLLAEVTRKGIAGVDVVKVAHHGSAAQSPALAERLGADVALVSAGDDNTYGHPTDTALDLYERAGAQILRTDECGTLALVVRNEALAVGGC